MNWKGQALIEVAVFFMALGVLLSALCGFTRWILVRQKLLMAAKQGAFMYSSGHMRRSEVERRMKGFLQEGSPKLNPKGIRVSVGPIGGLKGTYLPLDQSMASYEPPGGWHPLLRVNSRIVEKCFIRHAAHYWAPFQPWGGPAVAYGD
jgi:hypothetical protein